MRLWARAPLGTLHSGRSPSQTSDPFWPRSVAFSRAVAFPARWQLDSSESAPGSRSKSWEHGHAAPASNVPTGSSRFPSFGRRSTAKRRSPNLLIESALIESSATYFSRHAIDARAALATINDPSRILAKLLDGGHSTIAGRLAGAFRNNGRDDLADEIVNTMSAAGYDVRESDPFEDRPAVALPTRETSPYVNRIKLLWQKMREPIIERFPKAPGLPRNAERT